MITLHSMKFAISLALLTAGATITNNVQAACTTIAQADLPKIITTPGNYCFGENLTFAGPGNAIEVATGAVNLDLMGFSLTQVGTTANTNGVYVDPDLTNVHVFNGTITGFTGRGIWYDHGNNVITLNNLLVTKNGTGIFLGPTAASTNPADIITYVSNVQLTDSTLLQNGLGLRIRGNQNIYLDSVHCDESLGGGAAIAGIANASNPVSIQEMGYLHNLQIYNSTFDRGQGILPASSALGVSGVINPHIKGSSCNDNKLNGVVTVSALLMATNVNTLLEENQFNNNRYKGLNPGDVPVIFNGVHSSGNLGTGLGLTTTFTMRLCEANGNVSPGNVSGFRIQFQDNMLIENNRASKNRCLALTPVNGVISAIPQATGFAFDSSASLSPSPSAPGDLEGGISNSTIRYNVASENIAEQGIGAGFVWLGGNYFGADVIEQNLAFIGNISLGNSGLADSPIIVSNIAGGPFPGVPGIGGGIIVHRGVILNIDNSKLGLTDPSRFPAGTYRNLCIADNCLEGNVAGAAGTSAWNSFTTYIVGDVVSFDGLVYQSVSGTDNVNQQPNNSPAFWTALLPATGQQYSGGLVLIGVDSASATGNSAVGNTNGFVLTGGTTWAGQPIATTTNILLQTNDAVHNAHIGFWDAQVGVTKCEGKELNAFVENTAFNNSCNFKIGESADLENISIAKKNRGKE